MLQRQAPNLYDLPASGERWLPATCTDSEDVPPYGACAAAGVDANGNLQVKRPTRTGQTDVFFAGSGGVPVGRAGLVTAALPAVAAYQQDPATGNNPAAGDIWGAEAGSWFLQRARPGFRILGGADTSAGANLVNVGPMPATLVPFVQVTSATPQSGYYPAQEVFLDVTSGKWSTGDAVWFLEPNGRTPTAGLYYLAKLEGFASGRKVYARDLVPPGTLALSGGETVVALSSPAAPTVVPTQTGSTTWAYQVTALTGNGGETTAGPITTITNGPAVLSAAAPNTITWPPVPGATGYNVYRPTAGGTPSSTGLIGSVAALGAGSSLGSGPSFSDLGAAGLGSPPAANTTGNVGLGTTTPAAALQVVNPAPGQPTEIVKSAPSPTVSVWQVQKSDGTVEVQINQNWKLILVPSTTTDASLNIPNGTAPSSPAVGDVWRVGGHLYFFDGSVAQQLDQQGANAATEYTGTTASAFATVFDLTSSRGLHGSVSIKNSGVNGLNYRWTVKDLYGTSGTGLTNGLAAGNKASQALDATPTGAGVGPPYQEVKLEIQDQSAGSHTTYDVWASVIS
jgi:hypothetical protein